MVDVEPYGPRRNLSSDSTLAVANISTPAVVNTDAPPLRLANSELAPASVSSGANGAITAPRALVESARTPQCQRTDTTPPIAPALLGADSLRGKKAVCKF